jgi:hypothetical protein
LAVFAKSNLRKLHNYIEKYTTNPGEMLVRVTSFKNFVQDKAQNTLGYRLLCVSNLIAEKEKDSLLEVIANYITENFTDSWFRPTGRGKVLEAISNRIIADYFNLK